MEELEPAREQISFVWLTIIGVVLAAALGAGAVWIKGLVGRRIVPLHAAPMDDVDAAEVDAIEVAMMVADSTSRLPTNVRRMIREGTHADLEELCRPGGTVLLEAPEHVEEVAEDIEMLELHAKIQMLDDEPLGDEQQGTEQSRGQFGDPLLRSKLATSYLLTPTEAAKTTPKADPRSVMELHLGRLQASTLERLQGSIHGLGDGTDVLIEGPLSKLSTVANIQCWVATYVRVWADGRWTEIDDFEKTDEQQVPKLDALPTNVMTVFEVAHGANPNSIPADSESEPHDATLTVRTGKRGTTTQFYCAANAVQADKWVAGCETLAKTSTLPQPALIQFLEERSLGSFATKLAELAKIRTVDQLAITPVADTTLVLVGMNRFKQRLYRRAVGEAYKQQSAAAAKAAASDIPTLFEKTEQKKQRHEEQKSKVKVTEKSRAKRRKEEADLADSQTLSAVGARLIFDVQPMDVIELRKLLGDSDAKIEADIEARSRDRQRAVEKAEQQKKIADTGSALEGWACESCMHFNQDPGVKLCGGCSAPAHLVGGPSITSSKTDSYGEKRPTTPGGTIISKTQGSVLQLAKQTDEEIVAAVKAHEQREQAEAERKELGNGRGATPKKLTRNLKLNTAMMISELGARQERVDKDKIQKRQQALELAAAARAERLVALKFGAVRHSPRRLEPSRHPGARIACWMKSVWNTVPWVLRLRRQVPVTAPHLPGTAAFGSVRRSKYLKQATKTQRTQISRQPATNISNGVTGAAQVWDSESEDEDEVNQLRRNNGSRVQRGVYDSDEDSTDPDDWWYRYMLKHGTDKIMRRK